MKPAFDKIVDAFLQNAEPGSIEGRFVYTDGEKPYANFTCVIDNVTYRITMAPERSQPDAPVFVKDSVTREMKHVSSKG